MNIRVLEFGEHIAAGYCGRLYAQWGAEVIRLDTLQTSSSVEEQALDIYLHAGKRRIGLDMSTPEGRALLKQLAGHCDILLTDVAPSVLEQLRWLELGTAHKPVVKVSITPFGLSGPYRDWQADSAVILALGGYTFLMGDPGRAPLTLPGHYVEYQAAQYAYATSLAMLLRERQAATMQTHTLEISLLETLLSLSQFTTVMWTYMGEVRSRHGNDWQSTHPLTMYPCKDGWFAVSAVPLFWEAFTKMLGRPELCKDPRFATNDQRLANRAELDAIVHATLGQRTMEELLEMGQRQYRVPTGILRNIAQLLADPHLQERRAWQTVVDPQGKALQTPGAAFRYHDLLTQPTLTVAARGAEKPATVLEELRHG